MIKANFVIPEPIKTKALARRFVPALLNWNEVENRREMPWKGEKDPYRIWLSEVILQQTRVEQGLKYYQNFITEFPDLPSLAKAPEEKVFKLWEGLGYYSRCKNLIETSRFILKEYKGKFPSDHPAILKLKGVGHYTAAAIASFAFDLPYAVLDGNVSRVLSRIFDIELPIDSTEGKKTFSFLSQEILPRDRPGEYNQAIMDFGATICKPVPVCISCFYRNNCAAFLNGRQDVLPVKSKKIRVKERWMNYIVVKCRDHLAVRKRTSKDIWQQLNEFPLIETNKNLSDKQLLELFNQQYSTQDYRIIETVTGIHQKLTHQSLHFHFIIVEFSTKVPLEGFQWISLSKLKNLAFPRTIKQFIGRHI